MWSVESQPTFRRKMSPPSSTSIDSQLTTLRYILEDRTLYFLHVVTDPVTRVPVRICPPICEAYMGTRKQRRVGYMYS
jgi:hypothetical protein